MLRLLLLTLAAAAGPARAEFTVANIFSDAMVLQRGRPVAVWGTADADDAVRVSFAGHAVTGKAAADGTWRVELPAMGASAEGRTLTAKAGDAGATFKDVLVGEVWLCSGQSNMVWSLAQDTEWELEGESADYPNVRFCEVSHRAAVTPQRHLPGDPAWFGLGRGEERLRNVSGVAYYFAVRLHRYLKVPVGVIDNAWGGTTAEAWASRPSMAKLPELKKYLAHWDARVAGWPEEKKRRLADYERRAAAAKNPKSREPRRPRLTPPTEDRNLPGGAFNALIHPLKRLTLAGALFYQGENNCFGLWETYRHSFPLMIRDWRGAFARPKLPFGIVTLTGWGPSARDTEPELELVRRNSYARIRDVHFRTHRELEKTGLIVTTDLGDADTIHPHRKRQIGQRAARWALAAVYGKPVYHTAPLYNSMERRGKRVVLKFDYDPRVNPDGPWWETCPITRAGEYRGFLVAGEGRHFYPAQARRLNKEGALEVWNDLVPEPVAVRYGWAHNPDGNVIGMHHIPMMPFRTDDWPLLPAPPFGQDGREEWDRQYRAAVSAAEGRLARRRAAEAGTPAPARGPGR